MTVHDLKGQFGRLKVLARATNDKHDACESREAQERTKA
jgi:hypothetical protein